MVVRSAVLRRLGHQPGLVGQAEVVALRERLAAAAAGEAFVLQAGDCAESVTDPPARALGKVAVLDAIAGALGAALARPVVRVGRIAGQYAKPRPASAERGEAPSLPSFRGHIINGERGTRGARQHDPARMLIAYRHASGVMDAMRGAGRVGVDVAAPVWTSHEALVLDYETALTRPLPDTDQWLLATTHLPWIGNRTNQPDGAHVGLLANVINPVACKVGGDVTAARLVAICDRLDPEREPGRLTLISRMGAGAIDEALPPLALAVRRAGHRAGWVCDPMHANTLTTGAGVRTRRLDDIVGEVDGFLRAAALAGIQPAGLHLELADDDVTECLGGSVGGSVAGLSRAYTTLCDPRLNPSQAYELVERVRWGGSPHLAS